MKHVTLEEAKADLAALIEAALQGETVLIEEEGRPLIEVRPAVDTSKRLGFMADIAATLGPQTPIKQVGRKEIAEMFEIDEKDL